MFNKYKNKKKLVERGVYAINSGTYQNTLIVHIKEFDTWKEKAILLMPACKDNGKGDFQGISIAPFISTMSNDQMKRAFTEDHLVYVETIPKSKYKEFVDMYKALREDSNDTGD